VRALTYKPSREKKRHLFKSTQLPRSWEGLRRNWYRGDARAGKPGELYGDTTMEESEDYSRSLYEGEVIREEANTFSHGDPGTGLKKWGRA